MWNSLQRFPIVRSSSRFSLLCAFSVSFAFACSDSDSSGDDAMNSTDSAAPSETIALAFFGGYSSCFNETRLPVGPKEQSLRKVFTPAKEAADALNQKHGVSTPFLVSCYYLDNEKLSYALSSTTDPLANAIKRDSLEEIADQFNEQLLGLEKPAKLTIVGHSWGGWTAMRMATYIDPSIELGGLITLDPIDRENCGPVEVSASLTRVGGAACQRAPEHVTKGRALNFAEGGQWINFYQTKFAPLHSGPIPAASKNIEKTFNVSVLDPAYHIDFLKDQEVINTVLNLVRKAD